MKIKLLEILLFFLFFSPLKIYSQNVYELHKYTPERWLELSTDDHLKALNASNNYSRNQTLFGNFNRNDDKYKRWGYDYYEMNDSYESYAFRNFENYNIIENRRGLWAYNDFGDRLEKMTKFGNIWHDWVYDKGTSSSLGPTGFIYTYQPATPIGSFYFDAALVASESTEDWAVSAIGGVRLRTALTPLTMSIPDMNGMILDFKSANYQARIVNSAVVGTPHIDPKYNILRGMQIRRELGNLDIGFTFSNTYFQNYGRENSASIYGSLSGTKYDKINRKQYYNATPSHYFIRIMDDSPWDNSGPVVYGVRLKIDGVYRDDIRPILIKDDISKENRTALISQAHPDSPSFVPNDNFLDHNIADFSKNNYPKYADYLLLRDSIKGVNTQSLSNSYDVEKAKSYYQYLDSSGKPLHIKGTECLIYIFDLSSIDKTVSSVEAEISVSNDYRIQRSIMFPTFSGPEQEGIYLGSYYIDKWETVGISDGNIKDGSNHRTVRVSFGDKVANMIYGWDFKYDYRGLKMRGEYVTNSHFYKFPSGDPGFFPTFPVQTIEEMKGDRSSITDRSWYLTGVKDWDKFGLGFEFFKMGKFYDTESILVADNDDNDSFPDLRNNMSDPDGVYPGQDLDNDGIPDTDKNMNGLPDYLEPYMAFDSNPAEFAFGDDFNDNSVPDYREDDDKPDTPYNPDTQGHHIYLRYTPFKNIDIIPGSLRLNGIGVANRTFNDYIKLKLNYNVFNVGKLFAEYRYEKIKDNIHDNYFQYNYNFASIDRFWGYQDNNPIKFDELEYRNSNVNKFYVESRLKPAPFMTIENFIKYENNVQNSGFMYDDTYQPPGVLSTMAMANKAALTKSWGKYILTLGYKSMLYKKSLSAHTLPEDYYTIQIPLIYNKYTITPNMAIIFGMQGTDGFEYRYKDFIDDKNNLRRKDYSIQVQNKSIYYGFTIHGAWGFKFEEIEFDDKSRRFEDYKRTSFFTQIYLGHE